MEWAQHEKGNQLNEQHGKWTRVRYTVTGALAALAAVGAIAGSVALAGSPAKVAHAATTTAGAVTKTPTAGLPTTTQGSEASPNSNQPFLSAVAQLVSHGTITAAEGQTLASDVQAGGVDTDALAVSGFTQQQLQAVQQALGSAKESIANGARNGPPRKPLRSRR